MFGDSSERAYGAVIYLKSITDEAVTVRHIYSKARLAAIKRVAAFGIAGGASRQKALALLFSGYIVRHLQGHLVE